ncbi:MAG: phage tail protein [Acidobacteria bacterium]|nr:phage tail protein [Acidobacteriota bacterium]
MAETGSRNDPFASFNFLVEIDGVTKAGFSECTGINSETDAIEYRNGDEDITVRKLPGLKKFGNITFKRGYTNSKDLWEWRKKVMDGKTERKSGAVVLLNEAREQAMRWNFREAWPRKWDGPSFNAKNNEVAIETLEIVCEGVVLE